MAHRRGSRALVKTGKINIGWVRARDGDDCYMCGRRTTNNTASSRKTGTARVLEHVVPINLGGEDTMFNIRIACFSCDQKKGGGADMVNIFALLQTFEPYSVEDAPNKAEIRRAEKKERVLYKHVKPWTPPKPRPNEEVDGWWNYEDPPAKKESNAISATQITSREQLHAWWNRDKDR